MERWRSATRSAVQPSLPWLVGGWLIGCLLLSLWHLAAWHGIRRLTEQAVQPAAGHINDMVGRLAKRLGIRRAVTFLESGRVRFPTVIGWLRPAILVPAGLLSGLSARQLEALLVRELVHIRRCDYLVNLLQTLAETVLWLRRGP